MDKLRAALQRVIMHLSPCRNCCKKCSLVAVKEEVICDEDNCEDYEAWVLFKRYVFKDRQKENQTLVEEKRTVIL